MSRGTSIKRIREYFKLGDIDEVEVVLQLVQGDVSKRQAVVSQPALPFHKKARKPRAKKSAPTEEFGDRMSTSDNAVPA